MVACIINKIRSVFLKRKYYKAVCAESMREERLVIENVPIDGIEPLTLEERRRIDSYWSWTGIPPSYKEMGMFKHYCGFDPRYLTHYYYLPIVAHLINNYKWTQIFEHKSLLGWLVPGRIRFPRIFFRVVDGEFYNGNMEQISRKECYSECADHYPLILKDSTSTSGGISVKQISSEKELDLVITGKRRDFLAQELLVQHPSFAKFNSTSVNTLRVTTLYLNGVYSTLSIILRMGKAGASVDNWRGGILVGVDPDGKMHETGYDIHLNRFRESNGTVFGEETISQVPELLIALENAHKHQFPLCKLIGWDIAFNASNEPVVIELNSSQPGVIGEQLCTGPIFGNRTQEVIDYCMSKPFVYNRAIAQY